MSELLVSQPEVAWPGIVREYYEQYGDLIRAGIDLERRVTSLATAEPYLEEWWQAADGVPGVATAGEGLVPGSIRLLVLREADTIRVLRRATRARLGIDVEQARWVVRRRILADRPTVSRPSPTSPFLRLDLGNHFWAGAVIEMLDEVAPEAIGSLGSLVGSFGPNMVVARPIDVDTPLRDDFAKLAVEQSSAQARDSSLPTAAPLWRRGLDGRVFPIEVEASERRVHLADHRFRGVLMAAEPKGIVPAPSWLGDVLDDRQYTRFAGLVSANSTPSPQPEEVGLIETDELSVLARTCAVAPPEAWPRIVGMSARIGQVRSQIAGLGDGFPTSVDTSEIRSEIGPLLEALALTALSTPGLSALGAYASRSLRVPSMVAEMELGLVAPVLPGQSWHADRLRADLGMHLPRGWSAHIEAIPLDDDRWSDQAHLIRLR